MAQSASITAQRLHKVFALQAELSERKFKEHHAHASDYFALRGTSLGSIRTHAQKLLASSILAGTLMLAPPLTTHSLSYSSGVTQSAPRSTNQRQEDLKNQLSGLLPKPAEQLTPEQESNISKAIAAVWGIQAVPQLDGNRLNHSWGYMGAEQHLPRYPGDTIHDHDQIQKAGITPGLGAWGYFTRNKQELTGDILLKEKYYVAVQTMYTPHWNTNTDKLRAWYKFRKVLVVNPSNGKTIVADIADAGPAQWTGKQFGGSPEVMAYLGFNVGRQKGAALLFFVDDPTGEIPLGPVEYNWDVDVPSGAT